MKTSKKQLFYISALLFSAVALIQIGIIIFDKNIKKKDGISYVSEIKKYSFVTSNEKSQISFSGKVRSLDKSLLSPEVSGKIEKILVEPGDIVKKGEILAEIENINQRLALKNADISLNSAQLSLKKMQNNNLLSDEDSVISNVLRQQNVSIENFKNSYLNTDLRAYPEDYDESTPAPVISGNYSCEEEGSYIIKTYNSASSSGSSIYISGLEEGRTTVTTDYSIGLGNCGLEITFPKDFSRNKTWIIPVPNNRSSNYFNAKKNYENALSGKKIAIKTNSVLPEDISRQKDLVSQAALQREAALIQLQKTIIRSPFEGTITKVLQDLGGFASFGTPLFEVTSPQWEIITDISSSYMNDISKGQKAIALIEDKEYPVLIHSIVNHSESGSQKIPVSFLFEGGLPTNIFNEMFAEIVIDLEQKQTNFIEADFVGFGYNGPFINCNNAEYLVRILQENEKGYWIDFIDQACAEEILLPSLLR